MGYFKTEESEKRYKAAKIISGKTLHLKVRTKYEDNPKKCKHCEETLVYKKRNNTFCNASCAASFNNKGVIRNGVPLEGKKCLICDIQLTRYDSKYCSTTCQRDHEYKDYIKRWEKGLEDGIRGNTGTSKYLKRYLREKYNNSCQKCGWNELNIHTGNVPVQLHHVDGSFDNNLEENLELLCPNCHSLTGTFGSRGKGRPKR